MSTPTFSICHATYGRPEKAIAAMRMWFERADRPEDVEYIFAVNRDDPGIADISWGKMKMAFDYPESITPILVCGDFTGSAPAWDAAAKASTGRVLIQGQDDVEPPQGWDTLIAKTVCDHKCAFVGIWPNGRSQLSIAPLFLAVSDGYRTDAFCFMAIMSRAYYEQKGEFLHAGYLSVFSDDDVYYRAKKDARDGKCTLIEARDLVFKHRHCYHDKTVPNDATYARENSSAAYGLGADLFFKRNPEAHKDGLRNW